MFIEKLRKKYKAGNRFLIYTHAIIYLLFWPICEFIAWRIEVKSNELKKNN